MTRALADGYAAGLVGVPQAGPGVCRRCRGPGRGGLCTSCRRIPGLLDAVVPISWSVAGSPISLELRRYKDDPSEAARSEATRGLGAVLERFLRGHEACVAAAAGVGAFAVVTVVPARATRVGARGHLAALVRGCPSVRARMRRALVPGGGAAPARRFCPERFRSEVALHGEAVLLIDDVWTSGASAQSAACALRRAGAGRVALVVIGRHVHPTPGGTGLEWAASTPFDWSRCAVHPRPLRG